MLCTSGPADVARLPDVDAPVALALALTSTVRGARAAAIAAAARCQACMRPAWRERRAAAERAAFVVHATTEGVHVRRLPTGAIEPLEPADAPATEAVHALRESDDCLVTETDGAVLG